MSDYSPEALNEVWACDCVPGVYRVNHSESLLSLSTVGRGLHRETIQHFRSIILEGAWLPPLTVAAISADRALEGVAGRSVTGDLDRMSLRRHAASWPNRSKVLVVIDGKQRFAAVSSASAAVLSPTVDIEVVQASDLREAHLMALKANATNGRALTKADRDHMIDLWVGIRGGDVGSASFKSIAKELSLSAKRVEQRLKYAHPEAFETLRRASLH